MNTFKSEVSNLCLTFKSSYNQKSYNQGFLHSRVLTIRGSYDQGFVRSGVLMIRDSYDQRFKSACLT